MRLIVPLLLMLPLAACAGDAPPPRAAAPPLSAPVPQAPMGLDRVMGRTASAIVALFGKPDLDMREGPARKLQFQSGVCILDAYLYPPAGGGEPLVRHIDARRPTGDDVDRASCIAALSRRAQAR